MKLITAIVQEQDAANVANALVENEFRATRLTSAGGFLKTGNITFLIATEEKLVDQAIKVISDSSKKRQQYISAPVGLNIGMESVGAPIEVTVGGATIMVQDIERFEQV